MRRMDIPQYDPITAFDLCVNAVGDAALRNHYSANRASIQQANVAFATASQIADWTWLPRALRGNPNALIAGALSKQQLMDLYTEYMVGVTGPSRDIYDKLFVAAGGLCPLCGGLGHTWTLDHYLPKAIFPSYSVHPSNLVPSCRDCNSGKNASFGAGVHEQTLHPYFDQAQFFEERWIVASVQKCNPILIQFECIPPNHWSISDKERVRSHFTDYKLAYRFSVQAGAEISKVVELRTKSLRNLTPQGFNDYLYDNANSTDFVLNGWSRTMYAALAELDWFIQTDFEDPNWHLAVAA